MGKGGHGHIYAERLPVNYYCSLVHGVAFFSAPLGSAAMGRVRGGSGAGRVGSGSDLTRPVRFRGDPCFMGQITGQKEYAVSWPAFTRHVDPKVKPGNH